MTLYRADFVDSSNNSEWIFKPVSFREFIFLINFLANECDEEESDREIRIKALLNGDVVCTNLSAYKLIK